MASFYYTVLQNLEVRYVRSEECIVLSHSGPFVSLEEAQKSFEGFCRYLEEEEFWATVNQLEQAILAKGEKCYTSGVVESRDDEKGTIVLWINGIDESYTFPITPDMPEWLQPDVGFSVTFPRLYRHRRAFPPDFTGWIAWEKIPDEIWNMTEEELLAGIAECFHENSEKE